MTRLGYLPISADSLSTSCFTLALVIAVSALSSKSSSTGIWLATAATLGAALALAATGALTDTLGLALAVAAVTRGFAGALSLGADFLQPTASVPHMHNRKMCLMVYLPWASMRPACVRPG